MGEGNGCKGAKGATAAELRLAFGLWASSGGVAGEGGNELRRVGEERRR